MENNHSEFELHHTGEWLELRCRDEAIHVDFVGGAVGHRRQFGGGRGQPIARAVGLSGGKSPTVLDATAGLGRDAFVLASLGSTVTLIERSPIVVRLVEDALKRAAGEPDVSMIVSRMTLVEADAIDYMSTLDEAAKPDVIYLDPMYPPRKKSAQIKKEMRLLQMLLEDKEDAAELLTRALECAHQRVVVKRPGYAECLGGVEPTMAIKSKKHRFDVYVIKALS